MDESRDRVARWYLVCLCKGDECNGAWEVGDGGWVIVVVRGVRFVPEVPGDEWCVVDVVFADVLQRLAFILEVVVSFVRLLANWAVVSGSEAGSFEHVAGSKGKGEDGGKVVMKLVGGLGIVRWEGGSNVFEDWTVRFFVKECCGVGVDVGVGRKIDVFPLCSIDGIVDGKGKFEIVLEDVVW